MYTRQDASGTVWFLTRDAMLARYLLSWCVRLSVRPSQAGIVSKRLDESSWFMVWRLPSTYPTLCYKEMSVSSKITVLPCGTFLPNSGLGKFRHGKLIALSTKLVVVVVDGRACWRHLYGIRRVVAVYYKSVNCNPLTPFDLLWICRTACFYSWQDFDRRSASRGSTAVSKFLVFTGHSTSGSGHRSSWPDPISESDRLGDYMLRLAFLSDPHICRQMLSTFSYKSQSTSTVYILYWNAYQPFDASSRVSASPR